ncbi:MAG: DNA gyrase inhibitor YacG [Pseudomonadota bacterium]
MTCPTCGSEETVQQYRPFCSRRCADIDLARWMAGTYAIPLDEVLGEDEEHSSAMRPK